MAFQGIDKLNQDRPLSMSNGGWIKLIDDVPVTLRVIGYEGMVTSKKFGTKQYRFNVIDESGSKKFLDCNWRLMKKLQELIEVEQDEIDCIITQHKTIAEIPDAQGNKSKKLINEYSVELTGEEI